MNLISDSESRKDSSQNINLLEILDLVIVSKDDDLEQFWKPELKEISSKLLVPIKTDYVNLNYLNSSDSSYNLKPMQKSWFSRTLLFQDPIHRNKLDPIPNISLEDTYEQPCQTVNQSKATKINSSKKNKRNPIKNKVIKKKQKKTKIQTSKIINIKKAKAKAKQNAKPKVKLKTLKIRLFPNSQEKKILKKYFGVFRWYYNATLDILKQLKEKEQSYKNMWFQGSISNTKVRDFVRKHSVITKKLPESTLDGVNSRSKTLKGSSNYNYHWNYSDDLNEFPKPEWIIEEGLEVHNRIIRGAIKSYVGALNSAISNNLAGNNAGFEMKHKSKKNLNQILLFEDNQIPIELKEIKGYYSSGRRKKNHSNRISFKTILKTYKNRGSTLTYNERTNQYYFMFPVEETFLSEKEGENQTLSISSKKEVISLDPGVNTFQTCFDPEGGLFEIADYKSTNQIRKLFEKLDKLQSLFKKQNYKNRRLKLKRIKLYLKLNRMINELHWKTIRFLTSNYKIVIYPYFNTSEMLKSKILDRKTKRLMSTFNFFKFKERLKYKADQTDTKLELVSEAWTSKTCSRCGWVNYNLGSKKEFQCKECHLVTGRDLNGSKCILLRNWDRVPVEVQERLLNL